ncbi:PilN domain-containing protein [Marinilactibacillus piezotolerans]|uniref:PilN domain-containing protein n=1 Tax=Marinilactibacillus piezotolerans TaxID=258723 RepID=UPI0009B10640|nr:hypothetical protein [Marinilactibacillus piezotolerans]
MININFFEKKQVNQLPYVILTGFVVFSVILLVYLFGANQYYALKDQSNMQQIESQLSEVQEARQLELLQTQITEAELIQQQIQENRHSIPYLIEDIHRYLPDSSEHITAFNFTSEFELIIALQNLSYNEITELIEALNGIDYVSSARLMSLTKPTEAGDVYLSEISIRLSEAALREEESNEL